VGQPAEDRLEEDTLVPTSTGVASRAPERHTCFEELACTSIPTPSAARTGGQIRHQESRRPHHTATRTRASPRLWCHVHLQPLPEDFDFVPQLIGKHGEHTNRVFKDTGAKVRVRGRGSKHMETDAKGEAPVPLVVSISSDGQDEDAFLRAVVAVIERISELHVSYGEYCMHHSCAPQYDHIWQIREASQRGHNLLRDRFPPGSVAFAGEHFRPKQTRASRRGPGQALHPSVPPTSQADAAGSRTGAMALPGAIHACPAAVMCHHPLPPEVAWQPSPIFGVAPAVRPWLAYSFPVLSGELPLYLPGIGTLDDPA
jgi:hypothetical protein